MELKGKISIFIKHGETTIEVEDENANTQFLKITLTDEQLVKCLSRQGYVDCKLDVVGLDHIGKTHENDSFTFEITEELNDRKKEKELQELAQSQLKDGWIAESYFGSQSSFFTKDGKRYARVTIRRWL